MLKVGDVGPKKAALFWQELGITTVEGLEEAARAGKLRQLKGMGEKSESRILESIEALKRSNFHRGRAACRRALIGLLARAARRCEG